MNPSEPHSRSVMPRLLNPWWLGLLLLIGTLALYSPVGSHPYILLDDQQYVTLNPHVTSGLSQTNTLWAFTNTDAANWHPLTWLSHQLDCALFGVNAGPQHWVNVFWHAANTLLLFGFLLGATGSRGRSFLVAALFAWHPLHVESVAWVAERKDVLSTFFWLLTLWAYLVYTQAAPGSNRSRLAYWTALITTAAALLSKPMAVTLPFALLLLDFWPLRRWPGTATQAAANHSPVRMAGRLIWEKLPFIALSLAVCAVTYFSQRRGGALVTLPLTLRLETAVIAYARYVEKLLWPMDLAILYPYPHAWPLGLVALALVLVSALTWWVVRSWHRAPWLVAGWFWFLGTLVPAIGLVQVGSQSMADRYTYIPSIGFFAGLVWWLAEASQGRTWSGRVRPVVAGAALAGCLVLTANQLRYWAGTIPLFRHTLDVTTDNYVAANTLGSAYEAAGDDVHALFLYQAAVTAEPKFANSQYNLALALFRANQVPTGLEHLQAAAELTRTDAAVQNTLAWWFQHYGAWPQAADCLEHVLQAHPNQANSLELLGIAYANQGHYQSAADTFRRALKVDSNLTNAQANLERIMRENPDIQ